MPACCEADVSSGVTRWTRSSFSYIRATSSHTPRQKVVWIENSPSACWLYLTELSRAPFHLNRSPHHKCNAPPKPTESHGCVAGSWCLGWLLGGLLLCTGYKLDCVSDTQVDLFMVIPQNINYQANEISWSQMWFALQRCLSIPREKRRGALSFLLGCVGSKESQALCQGWLMPKDEVHGDLQIAAVASNYWLTSLASLLFCISCPSGSAI